MQIKFAKVLPLAAAVALVAACGKNEEKPANQAAAPAATSAPAAAAGGETVVKIGHAAPLTGGIAHLGKDNENGARLAVEEANKEGLTIDGKKIKLELVGEDDAGDPKTGTAVAQKLVDEHVVAVVGHLNSGVSIPASKIYSDAGIVQISPSSTNPDYTKQGFKTTYRVVATDAQQGPALANYAAKTLGAKTVAIVDDATAYGKGLADEFEKTAKADGVNVVAREATNDKATDFKAILTKIKGKKPDVIMYGGMTPPAVRSPSKPRNWASRPRSLAATACVPTRWPNWLATRSTTSSARKQAWHCRRWKRARTSRRSIKRASTRRCRSTHRSRMTPST